MMEAARTHTMPKEHVENLVQENEELITKIGETRAAMLSYKNMCMVIADQAKNMKLIHERKRDEHDNLLEALREMQSEGATKERVGKLYFIIMLSRWQEASVNKKYEAVICEVKDLRNELLGATSLCQAREIQIEENERQIRDNSITVVNLQHEVQKTKGVCITETKAQELDRIIQDLSDNKTSLEEEHFRIRAEYRQAKDTLDAANSRAEQATLLLDKLRNEHTDGMSQSLIELSEKLESDRLKKYRLERETNDLNERVTYLSRLIKNKDESIFKLEQTAAKFEGDMHKAEEKYRELDNQRQRKFFYKSRFDPTDDRKRGPTHQGGARTNDVHSKLSNAAGLT